MRSICQMSAPAARTLMTLPHLHIGRAQFFCSMFRLTLALLLMAHPAASQISTLQKSAIDSLVRTYVAEHKIPVSRWRWSLMVKWCLRTDTDRPTLRMKFPPAQIQCTGSRQSPSRSPRRPP